MIYAALEQELAEGLHALVLKTQTPKEAGMQDSIAESPAQVATS